MVVSIYINIYMMSIAVKQLVRVRVNVESCGGAVDAIGIVSSVRNYCQRRSVLLVRSCGSSE